jgi:hypothetical protein
MNRRMARLHEFYNVRTPHQGRPLRSFLVYLALAIVAEPRRLPALET